MGPLMYLDKMRHGESFVTIFARISFFSSIETFFNVPSLQKCLSLASELNLFSILENHFQVQAAILAYNDIANVTLDGLFPSCTYYTLATCVFRLN